MRPDFAVVLCTLITSAVASAIDPPRHIKRIEIEPSTEHELYKRRGGGGGGGRGGSSGGGGKSGSSGSGSSGSGSSRGSSGSSSGGGSRGVGPQPSFAGGRYYPGGASKPYRSGSRSPGSIAPYALGGAALAFWPGVWLYGAYMYPYAHTYHYHNDTTDKDEERDVLCGCAKYQQCACDDNNSTEYYDQLIGNGSYAALNKSIVDVAKVNGTMTILINGTLPNDTALPDASDSENAAQHMVQALGYWPAAAAVMAAVFIV